jgi:hypothetical protein
LAGKHSIPSFVLRMRKGIKQFYVLCLVFLLLNGFTQQLFAYTLREVSFSAPVAHNSTPLSTDQKLYNTPDCAGNTAQIKDFVIEEEIEEQVTSAKSSKESSFFCEPIFGTVTVHHQLFNLKNCIALPKHDPNFATTKWHILLCMFKI